jgi:hypothetical protein
VPGLEVLGFSQPVPLELMCGLGFPTLCAESSSIWYRLGPTGPRLLLPHLLLLSYVLPMYKVPEDLRSQQLNNYLAVFSTWPQGADEVHPPLSLAVSTLGTIPIFPVFLGKCLASI